MVEFLQGEMKKEEGFYKEERRRGVQGSGFTRRKGVNGRVFTRRNEKGGGVLQRGKEKRISANIGILRAFKME